MKACNCHSLQKCELRVSDSAKNPGRLYFKCNLCSYFSYFNEDDVTKHGEAVDVCSIGRNATVDQVKDIVNEFLNYVKAVLKMAIILYFILLVMILLK